MTLQLLICTFNDGIKRIPDLLLPPIDGVEYLVSWQQADDFTPHELPEEIADRSDVEVTTLPGLGLSRNRNNCFLHASADICLICDDDCRYTPEGLRAVIHAFEQNPDLDIITFVAKNDSEQKFYPANSFNLKEKVRNYYVTSIEIAFRRLPVIERVKFNEHFGLGSDMFGAGEEAIFIADAIEADLNCQFFPTQIVEHLGPTTSVTRAGEASVLRSNGAILYHSYRATMWLRLPLLAWRAHRSANVPFTYALKHLYQGITQMRRLTKNS